MQTGTLRQFAPRDATFLPRRVTSFGMCVSEGRKVTGVAMPTYEIRYLNSEGELTLIHKTQHPDDESVDLAALRMLMGSGLSNYEIWREDEGDPASRRPI
jgi:hypothetical protein